jgi:hypothetical protein
MGRYQKLSDCEGEWECRRVLAKAALLREDYDQVDRELDVIPLTSSELPQKDRADICLIRLERALWLGDEKLAGALLSEVDSLPAVSRVHYLAARRRLMAGYLSLIKGDVDDAFLLCGQAAEQLRSSDREDYLLDALTIIAVLACRAGQPSAGLRYVKYIKSVTDKLKEDITCPTE